MEDLIKAVKSLLSDIETMRSEGTYLFGSFSEYEQDIEDGDLRVEWPNLAISAENLKKALDNAATLNEKEGVRTLTETPIQCPKCKALSGDDWSQCRGDCPMAGNVSTLKIERNSRGFRSVIFQDRYRSQCSLQESSLASEAAIWLGVFKDSEGRDSSRMHLTQKQVKELLPLLNHFVETGELPE